METPIISSKIWQQSFQYKPIKMTYRVDYVTLKDHRVLVFTYLCNLTVGPLLINTLAAY